MSNAQVYYSIVYVIKVPGQFLFTKSNTLAYCIWLKFTEAYYEIFFIITLAQPSY